MMVLSACSCSKGPLAQSPSGHESEVHPSDGGEASLYYAITPVKLDAFLKYQRRRLELEQTLRKGSIAGSPADGGPVAGAQGSERAEGASAWVERRAEAEEQARKESKLSVQDVVALQQMAYAVIGKRALWKQMLNEQAPQASLMDKLPANARNQLEGATQQAKSRQQAMEQLPEERKKFGNANVDLILSQEAALTKVWEERVR
jgi:hypothetical protein